jgi:VanZ family protein
VSAIGNDPTAAPAFAVRRPTPVALAAAWGPVLVWLVVIFSLSSDQFSDVNTAAWLSAPLVSVFGVAPASIETANLIVRKTAHFVEYALLGMLTLRALRASWRRRDLWLIVGAVAVCAACASVDELRQHFYTATRTGKAVDVVLDSLGAMAGATVIYRHFARLRA